jgi:hypothetical protein
MREHEHVEDGFSDSGDVAVLEGDYVWGALRGLLVLIKHL